MYQLDLVAHSNSRFSTTFRISPNHNSAIQYANISIESDIGTFLNPFAGFYIELCFIEKPETMSFYTLKKTSSCSVENLFPYLANLLTELNVVPKGTPVMITFELFGKTYSKIIINAGLEPVRTFYQSMKMDKKYAVDLLNRGQKELSRGYRTQGHAMIQLASRVACSMFVYGVNPFDDKKHEILYDALNGAMKRHI
ncbi:hypothetical protein ACTFQF_00245 [Aliivibrio fischeri]|uniref:Uncharacterized protein n=1 Tax=Aliivibrio fischeri (strain MJ11) TaxID=388396 RepID=B5EW14_ALIFM|nr:hypothetical protein [Aliivibrio fischeri]ACH64810.1 hypothetical protein VFMJ11_B0071 [Aliivibrio fischeri MJ11]MUK37486.1 hypothetical protein [Aliivibrio fischeri]